MIDWEAEFSSEEFFRCPNWNALLVASDWYEENNDLLFASALRWMSKNKRRPKRDDFGDEVLYSWWSLEHYLKVGNSGPEDVPEIILEKMRKSAWARGTHGLSYRQWSEAISSLSYAINKGDKNEF